MVDLHHSTLNDFSKVVVQSLGYHNYLKGRGKEITLAGDCYNIGMQIRARILQGLLSLWMKFPLRLR